MAEGSPDHGATTGNLSTAIEGLSLVSEGSSMEDTKFSDSEEAGEEDESEESMVTLGFVQPIQEKWRVARQHFPSKVGGTPAWLDPINLPGGDNTQCGICNKPLVFLMQVYAPIGAGDPAYREECFHRSLFLFVCEDMACLQQDQHHQRKKQSSETTKPCRSVKVFRSQLPRSNRFYSYEPPSMEGGGGISPLCETVPLCTWCGTWKATDVCGGCKQTRYCCRTHQLAHWRAGHDSFCRAAQSKGAGDSKESMSEIQNANGATNVVQTMVQDVLSRVVEAGPRCPGFSTAASDKLWPEMELIVEDEEDVDGRELGAGNNQAQHLLEDYESRRREGGCEEFSAADMQDVEESSQEQQHWVAFQARLARAPDQVLRYCRAMGAKPLWPSLEGQPREADIAPCAYCGGARTFELQLLPQLLYFLGVQNETDNDSLDWATIAVYSCAASCNNGGGSGSSCEGYAEEFAWVQLAVT